MRLPWRSNNATPSSRSSWRMAALGFPPTRELRHPTLDVAGTPATPHRLYTELHDGSKLASSLHNGFPSSADWFAVGDDLDTDSIAVGRTAAAPNPNQLMSLFFDFGASSVCIELGAVTGDDRRGWVVSDGQAQPVEDVWVTTNLESHRSAAPFRSTRRRCKPTSKCLVPHGVCNAK